MLGAALALLACGSGEITAVGTTEIGAPPPDSTDTAPPTETGLSATDSGPRTETATPDSATDTAGTEDSATDTGPIDTTPPAWCPTVADPVQIGAVIHEDLTELSGVVESRKQPGVLWTHNDSGDTDRFFALSRSGSLLGTFAIDGVHPRDLEDLAIGPGPDGEDHYLYLGDVGDNGRTRDTVQVLRFEEPDVDLAASTPTAGTVTPEVMSFEFRDGEARDSESIFVDPLTGDLYSVIKNRDNEGISGVFRAEAPYGSEAVAPLVEVHELVFGGELLPGHDRTTGADISKDGEWILIRTYTSLFAWYRDPALPLWEAFDHNPCPLPLADEPQGEAIGFAANGRDYLTVSEGEAQPVMFHGWEE